MLETAAIEINNVSFTYPGNKHKSLINVNINIQAGQCTGLIGPNGAGKSTLLSILSGLIQSDAGQITFSQSNFQKLTPFIKRNVALVPQEYAFYDKLTVLQNLNYFASLCQLDKSLSKQRVTDLLQQCFLFEVQDQSVNTLSGGYKRRLNLAIALIKDPLIIYLDEPTVGVDPVSREAIIKLINQLKKQGKTIIFTSHMLSEVESICDKIIMLKQGKAMEFKRHSDVRSLHLHFNATLTSDVKQRLQKIAIDCQINKDQLNIGQASAESLFAIVTLFKQHNIPINSIQYGPASLTHQYLTLLEQNDPTEH